MPPPRIFLPELVLTVVAVTLLAVLFAIFLREYLRTKARFSLGLTIFAGIFLVKEGLRVLQVLGRAADLPVIGPRVGMFVALGEVVALATLLYLVSR